MQSKPVIPLITSCLLLATFPLGAQAAVSVQEVRGSALIVTTPRVPSTSATKGDPLPGVCSVQTAPNASAELILDGGVLRLGFDSLLQIEANGEQLTVRRGTVVFDRIPAKTRLSAGAGERALLVSGGTGFVHVPADKAGAVIAGGLAGRTRVESSGARTTLQPGEATSLAPDGSTERRWLNLTSLTQSAPLLHEFESPLPSDKEIRREVLRFASLQRRGFIQAPAVAVDDGTDLTTKTQERSAMNRLSTASTSQTPGTTVVGSTGSSLVAEIGFQSRVFARSAASRHLGNNGVNNGADAPPPGWQNPHNPHFGQPQNDGNPPSRPPGRGNGHRN